MKKKMLFSAILVLFLVLLFSGCATNEGPKWRNNWSTNPMEPGKHDFTILGLVTVEREQINILYLFGNGGITHADVLNEAKRMYPEANAVIDINISSRTSKNPFFRKRTLTATGFAVKYASEQLNSRANSN